MEHTAIEEKAMVIQFEHEDLLDSILGDDSLVRVATEIAIDEFNVSQDDAKLIGKEVLKLYQPI